MESKDENVSKWQQQQCCDSHIDHQRDISSQGSNKPMVSQIRDEQGVFLMLSSVGRPTVVD